MARQARAEYQKKTAAKLTEQFLKEGLPPGQAKASAAKMAADRMKTLAALHNPDLYVAGKDVITDFGDRNVNSSIGSQWKVESRKEPLSRAAELDDAARRIPPAERGSVNMNAKLERCK